MARLLLFMSTTLISMLSFAQNDCLTIGTVLSNAHDLGKHLVKAKSIKRHADFNFIDFKPIDGKLDSSGSAPEKLMVM